MAFQTNNSGTFDSGIMMQQQQLLPYSPFGSSIASSGSQVPRQQNSFPCTVHRMLSEAEAGAFSNVACWMPHGRSFKILDRKRFVKEILPRYFRQTKYDSFIRQLNMYGFQRLYRGLDKHAYYHRLFVRDAPGLTSYMERFGCKGTGPRRPAPSNEPNFYSVQSVAPPNCYLPPSTTTPVQYDTTLVMAAVMECCRMQNHDQAPSSSPLLPTSINMDHLAFPVMNDQKQPNKFNDELLSTAAAAAAAAGDGDDDDDDDHVGVLYEPFDIGDFMTDNSALFGQSLTEAQRKELLCNPFEEGFEW